MCLAAGEVCWVIGLCLAAGKVSSGLATEGGELCNVGVGSELLGHSVGSRR
jgi:hypothetical protein